MIGPRRSSQSEWPRSLPGSPRERRRPGQPAVADERKLVTDAVAVPWFSGHVESRVPGYAIQSLVRQHLEEVKTRWLVEIDKVEREVRARLTREINYWDAHAERTSVQHAKCGTPGHISVLAQDRDIAFFLAGDTPYNEELMLAGKLDGVSADEEVSRATLGAMKRLVEERPTLYLPTHDPRSAVRLASTMKADLQSAAGEQQS